MPSSTQQTKDSGKVAEYDISIFFAVLDSEMMALGGKVFEEIVKKEI